MDISAVRAALATNASAVTGLTCLGYVPDSAVPPLFYVGGVDIEFDQTMGRGFDRLTVVCQVLASRADDLASQQLLDGYLKGAGTTSLKAAISSDKTLGGACSDLVVTGVQGYRFYELSGIRYLGAQFTVTVHGRGN